MRICDFCKAKRQTGRTTRMLDEAKRLASEGRAVYVIALNHAHCAQLQSRIYAEVTGIGIKCEPGIPTGFDWKTMRVPGSHPNCVWLIDHLAIEMDMKFNSMFFEMTRFDAQIDG